MKSIKMIEELTTTHGPSGFEGPIREIIKKHLDGQAEFSQDNLGSLICKKNGTLNIPRIMIPGHMDEIGFLVSSITDSGYIKFIPLGGWWDQVLLAQRVIIKTRKGDINGIIGSTPPHLMSAKDKEKIVEKKTMFIDVGARNKENAQEIMGILPGDPIVPNAGFTLLNNTKMIMAKALDDRIGCCAFIDVIKELQNVDHPNTVYGVGTVQEEVGLRGAATTAHIIEPDICLTVDVTIATDVPGLEKEDSQVKLGHGPVLTLADASLIGNQSLRNYVVETAKKNNLPLQFNVMMGGGTDAGAIHKTGPGVPAVVISLPTRYIHSHYGVIDYDDYDNTVKLLVNLVKGLDLEKVNLIKKASYSG